jgi:hypothetical protein
VLAYSFAERFAHRKKRNTGQGSSLVRTYNDHEECQGVHRSSPAEGGNVGQSSERDPAQGSSLVETYIDPEERQAVHRSSPAEGGNVGQSSKGKLREACKPMHT